MVLKPVDTAIVMVVGPAIDDTDFKSLEESIAYNAAGMDISLIVEKTDGTSAVTAITLTTGGTSDWTHKDGGYYEVEITAAQNAEEGIAYLRGVCTGVLPFESPRYEIVKSNIYDSWIKGTDRLQIDAIEWLGSAISTPSVSGVPKVDITRIDASTTSVGNLKDFVDSGYDSTLHKSNSDLIYIHGTALTETDGQLAAGFKKLFDVATPLLVASDVMRGTDSAALASVCTDTRLAELDAANLPTDIADIPTVAEFNARTLASADYVVTTDTITGVTTVTNLTNAPTAGDLTAAMKTSVNDQVVDVMKTDTTAEMSQGAPPATPTFEDMVAYIYFKLRNKGLTTATEDVMYADNGTTEIMKATLSDNGTTFEKSEYISGV